MADILDRILGRVSELAPDLRPDVLAQVNVELRAEMGGCNGGYIAKRPADRRAWVIGQHLQAGAPLADCFAAAGIQRRQGHNILQRPLRKPSR